MLSLLGRSFSVLFTDATLVAGTVHVFSINAYGKCSGDPVRGLSQESDLAACALSKDHRLQCGGCFGGERGLGATREDVTGMLLAAVPGACRGICGHSGDTGRRMIFQASR